MKALDLPRYVFSRATLKANGDGLYVFTGGSACTFTIMPGSNSEVGGLDYAGFRIFKNRGSANLTISAATAIIYDTAAATSLVLTAGQAAILSWDGTYWNVVAKAN